MSWMLNGQKRQVLERKPVKRRMNHKKLYLNAKIVCPSVPKLISCWATAPTAILSWISRDFVKHVVSQIDVTRKNQPFVQTWLILKTHIRCLDICGVYALSTEISSPALTHVWGPASVHWVASIHILSRAFENQQKIKHLPASYHSFFQNVGTPGDFFPQRRVSGFPHANTEPSAARKAKALAEEEEQRRLVRTAACKVA